MAAVEDVAPVETEDDSESKKVGHLCRRAEVLDEGARRWRGRRRRGGRRGGRDDERPERTEPKVEAKADEQPAKR